MDYAQDKAYMLYRLGWSRGGREKHLPDEIIREISKYVFYDTRSIEYHRYMQYITKREFFRKKVIGFMAFYFDFARRRDIPLEVVHWKQLLLPIELDMVDDDE